MARARRRSKANGYIFFGQDVRNGVRVLERVSFEEGERDVKRGVADRVYGSGDVLLGYKPKKRTDEDLPSMEGGPSLTAAEMQAYAGLSGRSRTMGMTEDDRMMRRDMNGRALPAEDAIERVIAKVHQFAEPAWIDRVRVVSA